MEMLKLDDVKYNYKNKYHTVHALGGVSHVFKPGVFYAVVGKSGSGKTTLLSMMAGLDVPTSGAVSIDERDIKKINRDKFRLEHVSVIYQSLNLFPLLTVLENVTFPLEYRGISGKNARRTAAEKLESVGIDSKMFRRLPSMLSGGEQQRVAIARALTSNTEIILADEPTGNLDTENSTKIVLLLKELAQSENICVVVVTHDLSVSEQADVVLRISDGVIVEIADGGTAAAIAATAEDRPKTEDSISEADGTMTAESALYTEEAVPLEPGDTPITDLTLSDILDYLKREDYDLP